MPTSSTSPRGAERPRVEVAPPAVDFGDGELAVKFAAAAGLRLEPWQAEGLRTMLARRHDGKYAAFEYAEVCSRQNGKTAQALARALAGMFLLKERVVLWTAHEVKTSMRAWRDLRRLMQALGEVVNDNLIEVNGIPVKVNASNGSEGFERLDTGQEIKIAARSKGSGRGFSVDCLIIDEAFAFEEMHQDALLPMLAARPDPQIVYASSPPLDGKTGAPMYALRARALAGGDETLAYRDWGLDVDLDDLLLLPDTKRAEFLDRRELWAATNPALGLGRVSEESILRLRRSLSEEGFAREILGCWPRQVSDGPQWSLIPERAWQDRGGAEGIPDGPVAFAVSARWPDAQHATIAVSGSRGEEWLVQLAARGDGTAWVAPWLAERSEQHRPCAVVVDPGGPAGFLIEQIEALGVEVVRPTVRDVAHAAGQFRAAVLDEKTLRHYDEDLLGAAVGSATSRPLGNAWTWAVRDAGDASPLEAASLALWGAVTHAPAVYDVLESVW